MTPEEAQEIVGGLDYSDFLTPQGGALLALATLTAAGAFTAEPTPADEVRTRWRRMTEQCPVCRASRGVMCKRECSGLVKESLTLTVGAEPTITKAQARELCKIARNGWPSDPAFEAAWAAVTGPTEP